VPEPDRGPWLGKSAHARPRRERTPVSDFKAREGEREVERADRREYTRRAPELSRGGGARYHRVSAVSTSRGRAGRARGYGYFAPRPSMLTPNSFMCGA
jgi:hypothetical protein